MYPMWIDQIWSVYFQHVKSEEKKKQNDHTIADRHKKYEQKNQKQKQEL